MINPERRCWAEVDLGALRDNFRLVREKADGAAVIAVVKADAYGHGDAVVAPLFEREGADAFATACLSEALRLRAVGVTKDILILGYTDPACAAALAGADLTQTLLCEEYARALSAAAVRAGVTVRAHLKADTGMGRIGFGASDDMSRAVEEMARAAALPGLHVEGCFTHFAAADSALDEDIAYTRRQYAVFREAVDALRARGVGLRVCHCCNSAGTFARPEFHMDAVRPGIILYGEQPSEEATLPGLRPAMRLCARVSQVKTLAAGDAVGYGRTFRAPRAMRAATLTAGYADGYPRALSGKGTVSIQGRPARVLGRVCMDQTVVDVTEIPETAIGDTAILFGGGAADSTTRAARLAGTISYELLCGVSRRVPRVYTQNGTEIAAPSGQKGEEP